MSKQTSESSQGSLKAYITGFIYSLALTLTAYMLVSIHVSSGHTSFSDHILLIAIVVLAIVQLATQLVFFLHLDKESKPRWNLTAAAFALIVVLIVVIGSLWIMANLSYHHEHSYGVTHDGHPLTSPSQTNQYIIHDEGIQP